MKALPVIALTALSSVAAPAGAETACLRADDPILSRLVARGLSGSDTFRRLYQRLERSNLIVHLRRGTRVPEGSAYNQFVTYAGSYRFVRITLNVSKSEDDHVALLGHELRHAVELAEAPAVDDGDEYERLYHRIGYRCRRRVPSCYETDAAVTAGRDVLRELRKKSAGVGAALAVAHLLRRWVADDAGWLAKADDAP